MINTSTTAGKIAVMQAYENGKKIEAYLNDDIGWSGFLGNEPLWKWCEYDYRIKPQTVEEASISSANKHLYETSEAARSHTQGFVKGAQWQKEQDNE